MTKSLILIDLTGLKERASKCQEYFTSIDESEYYNGPSVGNALYIRQQAEDYLRVQQSMQWAEDDFKRVYGAYASSELSRILALALRECIVNDWNFVSLLEDGVEYEEDVIKDIEAGRRPRRSHKGVS